MEMFIRKMECMHSYPVKTYNIEYPRVWNTEYWLSRVLDIGLIAKQLLKSWVDDLENKYQEMLV